MAMCNIAVVATTSYYSRIAAWFVCLQVLRCCGFHPSWYSGGNVVHVYLALSLLPNASRNHHIPVTYNYQIKLYQIQQNTSSLFLHSCYLSWNSPISLLTQREREREDQAEVHGAFGNKIGLLGDYKTGKTLARDGVTVIHDFIDLGNEWQVLPVEEILFRDV